MSDGTTECHGAKSCRELINLARPRRFKSARRPCCGTRFKRLIVIIDSDGAREVCKIRGARVNLFCETWRAVARMAKVTSQFAGFRLVSRCRSFRRADPRRRGLKSPNQGTRTIYQAIRILSRAENLFSVASRRNSRVASETNLSRDAFLEVGSRWG